jgi:hypothetical protein
MVDMQTDAQLQRLLPESKNSLNVYIKEKLETSLLNYVSHLIRSSAEHNQLDDMLDRLQPNQAVAVLDWKMKLLSLVYRESMVEFFAKRGIPWFGVMLIRRRTAAEKASELADRSAKGLPITEDKGFLIREFQSTFYDCLSDDSKEDAFAVASHFQGVLLDYKQHNGTHVEEVLTLSDGAGCLSGLELLLLLPLMGRWTGIRVIQSFISEAGCGKTPLDGHFCFGRAHAVHTVKAGKGDFDIHDAASAAFCLVQRGGIANTTVAEVVYHRASQIKLAKRLKNIRNIHHRTYEYDAVTGAFTAAILRTQYGRGLGEKKTAAWLFGHVKKEEGGVLPPVLTGNNGTGVIFRVASAETPSPIQRDTVPSLTLGSQEKSKRVKMQQAKIVDKGAGCAADFQAKEEALEEDRLARCCVFHCQTKGCTAVYQKQGNLDNHIEAGKHWLGKSDVLKYTRTDDSPTVRGGSEVIRDAVIEKSAEALAGVGGWRLGNERQLDQQMQLENSQTPLATAVYLCIDGKQRQLDRSSVLSKPGFALRGSCKLQKVLKKSRAKKFAFIVWVHGLGEKSVSGPNAVKTAPERAAKLMRLVGTLEGQQAYPEDPYMVANEDGAKTFFYAELLHSSQIKAYMGKPHNYLVGLRDKWVQLEQERHIEFFQFDGGGEVDEEEDDEILELEEEG